MTRRLPVRVMRRTRSRERRGGVTRVAWREFQAMQRILDAGATPQQVADAMAALEPPRVPRQGRLL